MAASQRAHLRAPGPPLPLANPSAARPNFGNNPTQTKTGDITSRLAADTTKMSDQISLNLNVLLRSLVQAVTVLGFMLQKNVKLSFVTLISIPSVVYLSKKFGGYYQVRPPFPPPSAPPSLIPSAVLVRAVPFSHDTVILFFINVCLQFDSNLIDTVFFSDSRRRRRQSSPKAMRWQTKRSVRWQQCVSLPESASRSPRTTQRWRSTTSST